MFTFDLDDYELPTHGPGVARELPAPQRDGNGEHGHCAVPARSPGGASRAHGQRGGAPHRGAGHRRGSHRRRGGSDHDARRRTRAADGAPRAAQCRRRRAPHPRDVLELDRGRDVRAGRSSPGRSAGVRDRSRRWRWRLTSKRRCPRSGQAELPLDRGVAHRSQLPQGTPSAWPPASTGSNRSPCCSTRSSASRIPKRRGVTSSVSSSQRSGVETGAPGFGRTE